MSPMQTYTSFSNHEILAQGDLESVVLAIKEHQSRNKKDLILTFSDSTGKQMDFDLSGSKQQIIDRLKVYLEPDTSNTTQGPGRPKLGVVSREISLLPRQWQWLATQSGGASATLRRLIDNEMSAPSQKELMKQSQERTYKFLSAIAGDFKGYEEVLRALFANQKEKFIELIQTWPNDIKKYAKKLAKEAFAHSQ